METYTLLRQLADSWGLLVMFAFFVGIVIWVFRPGAGASYQETADIPFRHADKPATTEEARQ